jgi:hypothetical protein
MEWIIGLIVFILITQIIIRVSMKRSNLSVTDNNARILLREYDRVLEETGHLPAEFKYGTLIQKAFPDLPTTGAILSFAKLNSAAAGQQLSLRWVITSIIVAQLKNQKNAEPSQAEKHSILRKVSEVVPEDM